MENSEAHVKLVRAADMQERLDRRAEELWKRVTDEYPEVVASILRKRNKNGGDGW